MRLISRLYGFYAAFEATAGLHLTRSGWLQSDLQALGVGPAGQAHLRRCADCRDPISEEGLLGALYVVEGSALGGVALARRLDGLLGRGSLDGRRFFSGQGAETAAAWRAYLVRLSTASRAPQDRGIVISSAIETFALFERWMDGWNDDDE